MRSLVVLVAAIVLVLLCSDGAAALRQYKPFKVSAWRAQASPASSSTTSASGDGEATNNTLISRCVDSGLNVPNGTLNVVNVQNKTAMMAALTSQGEAEAGVTIGIPQGCGPQDVECPSLPDAQLGPTLDVPGYPPAPLADGGGGVVVPSNSTSSAPPPPAASQQQQPQPQQPQQPTATSPTFAPPAAPSAPTFTPPSTIGQGVAGPTSSLERLAGPVAASFEKITRENAILQAENQALKQIAALTAANAELRAENEKLKHDVASGSA